MNPNTTQKDELVIPSIRMTRESLRRLDLGSPMRLRLEDDISSACGAFSCYSKPGTILSLPSTHILSPKRHLIQGSVLNVLSMSMFEDEADDSISFRYGAYLEYWREGHSNSVSPKYKDLREEMTNNNVVRISSEKYDELYVKAEELLINRPLVAKQVGNSNKICGIKDGSTASVEHIIALLIYTDFQYHQCELKKQCRKLSANEPLRELIRRNSEIYHWCKLIKELCIFYGETMGKDDVLYSGMGEYLMFDSLCTRFECPISTSTKLDVATRFAKGAIILKFRRGSANTKTLDVTEYSCFGKDESERLVAGSSLQIVDILINKKSHKTYISALKMLEQIMNGHFIDGDDKITLELISLLRYAVSPTLTDKLKNLNLMDPFYVFLEDEVYDSDAIMEDIVDEDSSGIFERFGSSLFAQVHKCSRDHTGVRCQILKSPILRSHVDDAFSVLPILRL